MIPAYTEPVSETNASSVKQQCTEARTKKAFWSFHVVKLKSYKLEEQFSVENYAVRWL